MIIQVLNDNPHGQLWMFHIISPNGHNWGVRTPRPCANGRPNYDGVFVG
jgi:hypothetical protein